ncbi:MarR family transcriptional regulator [Janibacter melonis]|uniref:helix-turn-helix transcriptional regulator n=1 Tax=Janibacter melonis TaxID=262209 RepID=UPI00177D64B1
MKNTPPLGPAPARGAPGESGLTTAQRRTLLALQEAGGSRSVVEVAAASGVHPNTVRAHLEALVASGHVERARHHAGGRGRPSAVYAAEPSDHSVREYRALATAFVEQLASGPATGEALRGISHAVGRAWSERRDVEPVEGGDARPSVVGALRGLGFAPDDTDPDHVRLRTCPLLDVAQVHPDVVCQVHLGLVDGLLRRAGDDATQAGLAPFAEPGACVLHLERP